MTDSLTALMSSALALAGIVAAILLIGRILRRTSLGRPISGRSLIVKESVALDARRRLHLIQHGERSVLLLTGGANDLVVGWLEGPTPP